MSGGWGWQPDPVKREFAALRAMKVQLKINFTDVEHECSHGRLPLDKNKPDDCHCWPPEAIRALGARSQDNPDYSDAA